MEMILLKLRLKLMINTHTPRNVINSQLINWSVVSLTLPLHISREAVREIMSEDEWSY